jgi:hypothetical protein
VKPFKRDGIAELIEEVSEDPNTNNHNEYAPPSTIHSFPTVPVTPQKIQQRSRWRA